MGFKLINFQPVYNLLSKEEDTLNLDVCIHLTVIRQYVYDCLELNGELTRLLNFSQSKNIMKLYGVEEDEIDYMKTLSKRLVKSSYTVANYLSSHGFSLDA